MTIHRRVGTAHQTQSNLAVWMVITVIALTCGTGCQRPAGDATTSPPTVAVGQAFAPAVTPVTPIPRVRFTDITESAGVRFHHTSGAFGKRLLPETMGSGVAFFDYDKDGHQDLLFVNSSFWPGFEPQDHHAPTPALYRNRGDGSFDDVTTAAGLAVTMYGMGVTIGDYDNDGWPDLFITGVGGNRLFHSEADDQRGRRFVDRTESAGVAGPGRWPNASGEEFLAIDAPICFSSSAAFLDYDNDAHQDLFVCNYVTWSPAIDLAQGFQLTGIGRSYGPPTAFEGTQCMLYRNMGDGRFDDVSQRAGIHVLGPIGQPIGKSLGVIVFDPDDDGWPDIAVANDTVRNFFFHNTGRRTFEEIGELSGLAYAEGRARGAMGIDWGEYRPDTFALLIGNFADEPNTFLRLDDRKRLLFSDVATAEGVAGPSRLPLKFGAVFLDYDLDGRQDLVTCNGHLEPEINKVQASQTYKQSAQLFWNCGELRDSRRRGCFVPVSEHDAGPDLFQPIVGRACAYADIDGDGDLDLALTENGGPVRLLRNDGGSGNHWTRIVVEGDGERSNRSAIGAKVTIESGGIVQHREVASARGYLSQSETAVTFGLGRATRVDRVTIRWPGPNTDEILLADLPADAVHVIRQSTAGGR